MDKRLIDVMDSGRRPGPLVPAAAPALAGPVEPPHPPQGADRRRGGRLHRRGGHRRRVARATPATRASGATPTSAIEGPGGRRAPGGVPRQLGRDRSGAVRRRRRPLPATSRKPGDAVVQCVRGASETGWSDVATLFRTLLQLAERRVRITTAVLRPRRRARRSPVRRRRSRRRRPDPAARAPHRQAVRADRRRGRATSGCSSTASRIWNFQPIDAARQGDDGRRASWPTSARPTSTPARWHLGRGDQRRRHRRPTWRRLLDAHFDEDLERSVRIEPGRWERRAVVAAGRRAGDRPGRNVCSDRSVVCRPLPATGNPVSGCEGGYDDGEVQARCGDRVPVGWAVGSGKAAEIGTSGGRSSSASESLGAVAARARGRCPTRPRRRSVPEHVSVARPRINGRHDGAVTDGHDGVVRLELPIESQYIRVARLVASGLGDRRPVSTSTPSTICASPSTSCAPPSSRWATRRSVSLTFSVSQVGIDVEWRTRSSSIRAAAIDAERAWRCPRQILDGRLRPLLPDARRRVRPIHLRKTTR